MGMIFRTPFHSLWSEKINLQQDWKTVGKMPCISETGFYSELNEILKNIEEIYVVKSTSGRIDVCHSPKKYILGDWIIFEADRGEDCAKIVKITSLIRYLEVTGNKVNLYKELIPKKIYRKAQFSQIELQEKTDKEEEAKKNCAFKIETENLDMQLISCEYQWDYNKLTFFYSSDEKVDFRKLVKELYKEYKVRIWMCSIGKLRTACFKELLSA